jgi:coniferyl-aldehyde dehydrogenase
MDIAATTSLDQLASTHTRLRAAQAAKVPDRAQRLDDLDRLRAAFKAGLPAMCEAISADFGHRSRHETLLSDGMTVLREIDDMRHHLRRWMRPQRAPLDWLFLPGRSEIRIQPLGVVGIISPWNYPVNLALMPLATAIAAGNHVYLKPSENTPRTSQWLHDLLESVFPADRVAVALGGADVAGAFAALPFDHLFFTGSTAVGRKVMAAAAPNLTPVTLELGGKSPCIVAPGYPAATAAARIAAGKWLNAGQTCIAPDYLLVEAGDRDALVAALQADVGARYARIDGNSDYTAIVNEPQYRRLRGYLEEARALGCEIIELAPADAARAAAERRLPPTLVIDPPDSSRLMTDEIFGPILPIRTVASVDAAIDYINAHDRPLALYHFDLDAARTERVLQRTVAGGVCINDTVLHIAQDGLPFGGVGASGMGHYHGRFGFFTFSKQKPVFRQARWSAMKFFKPPYGKFADTLLKFLVR